MNRHTVWPIKLVAVAVLATGCAAVQARDGAASPAPAIAVTARDNAAEVRAALAERYLALAGPLNVRVQELGRRVGQVHDLAGMREVSLAYAAVEDEFVAGLRALPVPDDLKPVIRDAISAGVRVAALNRRAAAGDDPSVVGPSLSAALDAQRAALGQLRGALGLGEVPQS